MNNTQQVMSQLDAWVKCRGSGQYIHESFKSDVATNYSLPENFGIQQVREEISSFVDFLLTIPKEYRKNALEIGFGYYGSTHFLWRLLFDKITTIEYQSNRVLTFGENTHSFYKKWILDDGRSSFIFGKSNEVETLRKAYNFLYKSKLDMLFIDGDHRYEGIMADYLLYEPLVKKGGIIAFHDCVASVDSSGVPKFLNDLSNGKFGNEIKFTKIICSEDAGIAYYRK